jgi:hypothetical protein
MSIQDSDRFSILDSRDPAMSVLYIQHLTGFQIGIQQGIKVLPAER